METLHFTPFIAIKKQGWRTNPTDTVPLDYPELDRYIDFYYVEKITDWNVLPGQGRYTFIRHEVHGCLETDFGTDEGALKAFATWNGYNIVCMDFDEIKGGLQGDPGSMYLKELVFKVDRCVNKNRKPGSQPCKPENEIEEFISDLGVDSWVV